MIVSINQPAYLPWLGYFERIRVSDVHVVLDHVQFEKNGYANRNKVRTAQGWTWLTVPVKTSGHFKGLPLDGLEIDATRPWAQKHWRTLEQNYAKAPYFAAHAGFFERLLGRQWGRLGALLRESTRHLLEQGFGIRTPLRYSSEMGVEGRKSELVLNLCRALHAKTYLSGPLGRDYLDEASFRAAGIEVRYHDYAHPAYRQAHAGFEPAMSAVDLLFNHGPESSHILATGAKP